MHSEKIFPELKIAEVNPIFKKNDPNGKINLSLKYTKRCFMNKLKNL